MTRSTISSATVAPSATVVLAAGEGTRMRSRALPKVLHPFAGRSMLAHVLAATEPLGAARTLVVVGHRRDEVIAHLAAIAPDAQPVVQAEQHGTGHAVRLALEALQALQALDTPEAEDAAAGVVLVVPGDAPLLTADALARLVDAHAAAGAAVTLLTSEVGDPTGYGRVIRGADGTVERIVEHRDASPEELTVHEVATSVYAFDGALLREAVVSLPSDNAAGEQYLTDAVALLHRAGHRVEAVTAPAEQTAGVNDRVQLAAARRAYNDRLLEAHMRAGVTVVDPATTWVDAGVTLDVDVVLHPSVELHGATAVAEGAEIGPQVSLTDTTVGPGARVQRTVGIEARVGAGATVGPFAYLRPGTRLGEDVHIGTYVEVKNGDIGTGSKVPHLTYVGDATIGRHSNVGAGSVFVNYDGVAKHRSVVGDHVRIGSDTMLVAPVEIGDGAYTAAGSTITQDVAPGAMGVARARQRNVAGWVARSRAGTPSARAAEDAVAHVDADDAHGDPDDVRSGDG